jgi:pimeloyl-ACP methyl ester carboxylesterase
VTAAQNFTTSDGISLAYDIDDFTDPWRRAPTVLLLHAAMGSARRYFGWVPHLARDYRVVRLDLRGHGKSQVPPAGQSLGLDRLVADVVELLDHLGCDNAHVVGNSAGGYLGQQLAMNIPSRVRSLALFGSTPGPRTARRRAGSRRSRRRGCAAFSPRRSATGSPPMPTPASSPGFSTRRPRTTRPISPSSCC